MNIPNVGDVVQIHSYKHNGKIHRAWKEAIIVDYANDYVIVANNRTKVTESDGRNWFTREPAICCFFKNYWFNVIGMLRNDGIHYYCNLCSPYLFEEGAIKYVDYDLDIKVFPNRNFRILDRDEFEKHRKKMRYPIEIEQKIENEMKSLIELIKGQKGPFAPGFIEKWYNFYKTNLSGGILNERP
jgi:protein associated with RNAse G/E